MRNKGLWLLVALISIGFLAGLTLINYRYSVTNPGGNDFAPRWVGARLFITEGVSPYSHETTSAIQNLLFGRPARPDEDQSLFVYPLYTVYLMAPFALLSYGAAKAIWLIGAALLLGGVGYSVSRQNIVLAAIAFLSPTFFSLAYTGQLSVIFAALCVAGVLLVSCLS